MSGYPEQLKLENQLCFLLYNASRSMTRLYRPLLDELGVTYPQYLVLMVLWESEPNLLSIGEIGELLGLDTGTLTPLLKRLESNGFVTRVRLKEDERRVVVSLTDLGASLQEKAEQVPLKLMCQLGVSDNDLGARSELMGMLKELNYKLQSGL